jgi:TM2 domain-containing membrane protein YozV
MNKTLALILILLLGRSSMISASNEVFIKTDRDTIIIADTSIVQLLNFDDGSFSSSHSIDPENKKRLISAMLAFPFPFGFMGAHRVMLGCEPWVPIVYMATFGGCFGVLPMIDFCAILFTKDIKQYENNPHIFMWLK